MSSRQPYLSIIIPSYRSASVLERNLPVLLTHLQQQSYDYEVIVVDDGSNDSGQTQQVAAQLGVRFEANPVNMGKGAAVRRGMQHATGQFRLFTDADIPFELDAIDRFVRYLDFKEFDIVIGDRTLPDSHYFDRISSGRNLSSKVFSFVVGRFVTTGVPDTQCGLKGFRAAIADDLFSVAILDRFAFDVELMYIALKRNYDIKRLPVALRSSDGSSVSVLRHSLQMLSDLLKIKLHHLKTGYRRAI